MDRDTIMVIIVIIIILGIGVWCMPPDNVKEKMEKMTPEERKKREFKNVMWALFQFIMHPITIFIIFFIAMFISTYE